MIRHNKTDCCSRNLDLGLEFDPAFEKCDYFVIGRASGNFVHGLALAKF
jgi:hypothetical protein